MSGGARPRERAPVDLLFRRSPDRARRPVETIALVAAWAIVVLAIASRHVFWADEVRAWSFATLDGDVVSMLRHLRGDGHPALWHLLLRVAHALVPSTFALPLTAFVVAFAMVVLLVARSPFAWPLLALFLASRIGVYEYVVMARNYGISALLMFAFAACYERHRGRGIVLGVLLALLANTNALSVGFVVAYLAMWALELAPDDAEARRVLVRNALVALVGIALCVATVFPTFNDAAQIRMSLAHRAVELVGTVLLPGRTFHETAGSALWRDLVDPNALVPAIAMTLLLWAGVLGLVRRRAAVVAAAIGLLGIATFFAQIYQGSYRHEALWIVFLLSLYWIVGPDRSRGVARVGRAAFVVLLAIQVVVGVRHLIPIVDGSAPESRSRDLGALLASDPRLAGATVMADPDDLVEGLPYYAPNPIWMPREQVFRPYTKFTTHARLALGLDDLIADARRIRAETGRPVVLLMNERLERDRPARDLHEVYDWTLSITPESTARFLDATERLARYGPVCCSPESFDVYLLK